MGGADLSELPFQGFSGSFLLEQNPKVLTRRRSGCEKHPTALLVAFNLTPKLQPCGKSHLVNVQNLLFIITIIIPSTGKTYAVLVHVRNRCLRGSQWLGWRPAGNGGQAKRFASSPRFSLCVRLKWRERHQLLTLLLLPFCLTFLFFWHWFERKNINKTN